MRGYQVVGKTLGPTMTIWTTEKLAKRYLKKEIKPLHPNETWWIMQVRILGVSKN